MAARVGFDYARAVVTHDGVFIVLGGIQIVATALIMFYTARYKDMPCPDRPGGAGDPLVSSINRDRAIDRTADVVLHLICDRSAPLEK